MTGECGSRHTVIRLSIPTLAFNYFADAHTIPPFPPHWRLKQLLFLQQCRWTRAFCVILHFCVQLFYQLISQFLKGAGLRPYKQYTTQPSMRSWRNAIKDYHSMTLAVVLSLLRWLSFSMIMQNKILNVLKKKIAEMRSYRCLQPLCQFHTRLNPLHFFITLCFPVIQGSFANV